MIYTEKGIKIAVNSHFGIMDKTNIPSIFHSLRVMLWFKDDIRMAVGVLHDTIEDTKLTLDDLRREGFSEEIVLAVDAISRRKGEIYMDYIKRVSSNKIARDVKIADLKDNMNRNDGLPENEKKGLTKRYLRALDYCLTALNEDFQKGKENDGQSS